MKFACPQKAHAIQFESAWDYLNHLQKCHLINDRIKDCGETRNEYYFCASCLQVFELITERDMHQHLCKVDNFKQLFKDVNKPIPLGKSGTSKIQELIRFYKDIIHPKQRNTIDSDQTEKDDFQQEIIEQSDSRAFLSKTVENSFNPKTMIKNSRLTFSLLGGHTKMEAAYYKLFNKQVIEQINKEYPFKITPESFKLFFQKNNITLSKELLNEAKVCEFCESKIDQNPEMYLQIIQTNNSKSIWLMIPEIHNPVKEFGFDEPWCVFKIMTKQVICEKSIDLIKIKKQDPLISQLEYQIQQEELRGIRLKQQLQNSVDDLDSVLKYLTKKNQKLDQQENLLVKLQIKLRENDTNNKNLVSQYLALNSKKLQQAEENLIGFYQKMKSMESEKQITKLDELKVDLNEKELKQKKLKEKVRSLFEEKEQLIQTCNDKKNKIQQTQKQLEDKIAKASVTRKKIQKIKQLLCFQCQTRERNVIQFPCQHFLFCEQCYLSNIQQKNLKCPLKEQNKCQTENLNNKYKLVNIQNV
ncbi:unnamed protein product (macronuclear) [Paramecium tetraurelia]|uniref:RING-type domain-containing protein n=1 Tax=Paramecium tetraurelia TaxID=5888 RepID=A0DNA1_PARTE|nr:uncharacterized protein GSPATT00018723001 [Paramecium tetraurelia]CAK84518.1 unnamed protein product [Paramecium tetraurelia]|eukprot:XP_001451915.1 hypothetical protein (macronuclear) [Paramecium tetraurelia strain d4-2]